MNDEPECCEDWTPNTQIIDGYICVSALRAGTGGYEGKPFAYCPWCGKKRPDEPSRSTGRKDKGS